VRRKSLYAGVAAFVIAACLAAAPVRAQQTGDTVTIGATDIGGVVRGANGPEAGVWVIAETTDLPTKFAKIVVTDDHGRYVIPDLPKANYSLWVRGYGLVDSPKVASEPGKIMNLEATAAPNEAAAAQYYPAIYWYAMIKIPGKSEFPAGPMKTQGQYLDLVKTDGCYTCHQLGNKATRTIPAELGHFKSSLEAWERRIQSGQAMANMANNIGRMDAQRTLAMFADWTDRIAEGELPAAKPPRPQGLERNVVITLWDWSSPKAYLHDEIATDKRNPTVNANGLIYGAPEESTDFVPILDPVKNVATQVKMPVRDPNTASSKDNLKGPSAYWGDEVIWESQASMHNPMIDEKGRVWFTSRVGPPENPAFCRKGSDQPSAKIFPTERSTRHLSMLDPKTGKITLIRTCFSTHHLQFGFDANNTLWMSAGGAISGGDVVGWLNTKMFDATGDEEKSQGWTPLILDTNGNGKRDDYVEPKDPVDPTKDKRVVAAFYGIAPSPADGSVWGSVLGYPGAIIHLIPGSNPSETAITELYEVPADDPTNPGYSPRGMDIDSKGVVWAPLASGHLGRFDRSKCKVLNGPTATGKHCPEGWTLYPFPGPQLQGVTDGGSAEASYYTWVDQHDTFGLGKDVPWATGNANDSLMAFVDGKFLNFHVPYPMGFYAKGLDGRIDDPNAGWKGRGVWSTTGNRTPFHLEGGKGTLPKVVRFQLRPDPLAR
jgi:streptogramin lyase